MNIALIELHDGNVSAISVSANSEARIEFSHLSVFHRVRADEYEVFSHPGALLVSGATTCTIAGSWSADDKVIVAKIDEREIRSISSVDAFGALTGKKFALIFENGTTVVLAFELLRLELGEAGEKLDDWDGPLQSVDH